jgi:CMP-N,N'-diacetyllegionaminic acid synthase
MTYKNRSVVALIPARGGSKGIVRKNLRMVLGKPLVAYSVEAARRTGFIDHIYVSSDCCDILALAERMGVNAMQRAAEAATDSSTAPSVVIDFLRKLPKGLVADNPFLVYLQPTSPLRNSEHISAAFDEMSKYHGDSCLSVTELKRTPFKSFSINSDGRLQSLFDEGVTNANRQSLPSAYYPNGAIYIFTVEAFLTRGCFPSNGSVPYVMSEDESIDVDSEEDITEIENYVKRTDN